MNELNTEEIRTVNIEDHEFDVDPDENAFDLLEKFKSKYTKGSEIEISKHSSILVYKDKYNGRYPEENHAVDFNLERLEDGDELI